MRLYVIEDYMLTKPDFVKKKLVLVYAVNGEKISCQNDNIIIVDRDGNTKLQQTCYALFAIFVIGDISITTGLIQKSKNFNFSIMCFNRGFKLYAYINLALAGNTLLRKRQYSTCNSIAIANKIVINKIQNQCEILNRLRSKEATETTAHLNSVISKLQLSNSNQYHLDEIMGVEGFAAKIYFNQLFKDLGWKGRKPRMKIDKINVLLDIGYTVLFNYVEALLHIYGFDVFKGNLHKEFFSRKSLVCDMIEPFRPIIDYKIRKMTNLGQTQKYRYTVAQGQFSLNWDDSLDFIKNILQETIKYQEIIFVYIQQYYRWFMNYQNIDLFPLARLHVDN